MAEMSLSEQIKQLDVVLEYVQSIRSEAERLDNEVNDVVTWMRHNGLRMETADKLTNDFMYLITEKLEVMFSRIQHEDCEYLEHVKNQLKGALHP